MRCDPNWSVIKPRTSTGPLQIRPLTNEMACLTFQHYFASHCLSPFLLYYVTSPLLSPSLLLYSPPAWWLVAFQNNCTVILKLMPNCFTTHREKRPSQLLFCFHLTETDIMLMILPTRAWKSLFLPTDAPNPHSFFDMKMLYTRSHFCMWLIICALEINIYQIHIYQGLKTLMVWTVLLLSKHSIF